MIANTINTFWLYYPALFYGLSSLLGFYWIFYLNPFLIIPLLALWLPFLFLLAKRQFEYFKPLILSMLLFGSSVLYGYLCYTFPTLTKEGIQGRAHIKIESLTSQTTFFGKNWIYRCQLNHFVPQEETSSIAKNLKCTVSIPRKYKGERPNASRDYLLQGKLSLSEYGNYILKPDVKHEWKPIDNSHSFAEWRYQMKNGWIGWIESHISDQKSALFLSGLLTGIFDDRFMQHDFARFGLQHIMAISGFHFAIFSAILSFFLRLWISPKLSACLLILLLSGYFFFLGISPSILRAWIMISLGLLGFFLEKQHNSLNLLGVALMVILFVDPLFSKTLGFQFSFLATSAILLAYKPMDYIMSQILLKRPLSHMVEMNIWNQHAYCILTFFRQALSLTIVINLFTVPVLLFYFHRFPFMSLFYNLFFPFLVSLSMFLLLIGLIFSFVIPPLGKLIHTINTSYTYWILNLTSNLPVSVDIVLELDFFTPNLLICYLTALFLAGIVTKLKFIEKKIEYQDSFYL